MVNDYTPYRVMDSSEYPPGNCFVTGSAQGPFIDTGVYIPKERFGQLVLSRDFIAQAAHMLGLFADVEEKIQQGYDVGFADGVKEEISVGLDRAVDQLGLAVDVLRSIRDSGSAVVEVVVEPESAGGAAVAAGAEPSDIGKSKRPRTRVAARQGDRIAVDERPAGVPAGASDVDPFRV